MVCSTAIRCLGECFVKYVGQIGIRKVPLPENTEKYNLIILEKNPDHPS